MSARLLLTFQGLLLLGCYLGPPQNLYANPRERPPDWQCAVSYRSFGLLDGAQAQSAHGRAEHAARQYLQTHADSNVQDVVAEIDRAVRAWWDWYLDARQDIVELDAKLKANQISVVDRDVFTRIRDRKRKQMTDSEQMLVSQVQACEVRYGFSKVSNP